MYFNVEDSTWVILLQIVSNINDLKCWWFFKTSYSICSSVDCTSENPTDPVDSTTIMIIINLKKKDYWHDMRIYSDDIIIFGWAQLIKDRVYLAFVPV